MYTCTFTCTFTCSFTCTFLQIQQSFYQQCSATLRASKQEASTAAERLRARTQELQDLHHAVGSSPPRHRSPSSHTRIRTHAQTDIQAHIQAQTHRHTHTQCTHTHRHTDTPTTHRRYTTHTDTLTHIHAHMRTFSIHRYTHNQCKHAHMQTRTHAHPALTHHAHLDAFRVMLPMAHPRFMA
jgi:hypothetical protein